MDEESRRALYDSITQTRDKYQSIMDAFTLDPEQGVENLDKAATQAEEAAKMANSSNWRSKKRVQGGSGVALSLTASEPARANSSRDGARRPR